MPGDPFQIDILPEAPLSRAAFIVARPFLERFLALSTYRALYRNAQMTLDEPFESRALGALDIQAEVSAADLDHIPRSGPVIVAANHPHGIVDGLILMSALRRVRPDIRVLTNQLLARIPELRDCCLFVDPFDAPGAEARSRAGLRAAHLWLRGGGALIVFPAGEVAHARRAGGELADSAWKPAMSRLAMATGAPVIPAFVRGRNSQTFYAAGRVHPLLRTMLLPRELLKKRGCTIELRFGARLSAADWVKNPVGFAGAVRSAVDQLAAKVRLKPDTTGAFTDATPVVSGFSRTGSETAPVAPDSTPVVSGFNRTGSETAPVAPDSTPVVSGFNRTGSETAPVAPDSTPVVSGFNRTGSETAPVAPDSTPVVSGFNRTGSETAPVAPDSTPVVSGFSRTDSIAIEVAALSSECRLVDSGPFQVFCARAEQIPAALREIGRLRAITFRAVGEGSDRVIDLDRFDARYLHLFLWDNGRKQIVGAYRIGQTDRIVADAGVDGLYTRTLFRYDERLIRRMPAPALELGRSFIRAEYQRNYNALLLLWKGIGRFIARHPEYRLLFGPVSISARYSDASQQLLMSFLQRNHFAAEFGGLVSALHRPRVAAAPETAVPASQSLDELNRLVEQAEADGKGMPVLLRQYLKLNARLLGFNLDPAFGEALDALMLVDLTTVDLPALNRYLGRGDAQQFLAFHDAHRLTSEAA